MAVLERKISIAKEEIKDKWMKNILNIDGPNLADKCHKVKYKFNTIVSVVCVFEGSIEFAH